MSTTTEPTIASPFLTTAECASYLKVPEMTLYAWRARGKGPTAVRIGRGLRYRITDVDAWVSEQATR